MRMKVSDYIAKKLVQEGISDVFMITGGGAMHLDDGLGHEPGLHCYFNHHEQACAIAAECYARIHNKIAAVCVTTGPGGTNAITGVVGGWLDSIPMLILSGQVRYDTTAHSTGLAIRAMGDQEFEITKAVSCMTKYCEMVLDPMRIRFCVEKALYLSQSGRKGPTWLDIPLDIQGAYVETDALIGFDPADYEAGGTGWAEKSPAEIPEDTDLIFVMGGTNDGFCASFVEFGNSEERAPRTFWGDLDELMDGLKEDYPEAEVIFLTPIPNSLHDYLKAERKYLMPQEEFSEVIITLAEEHGMEVFDLYNSNILDGHDKDNILHLMPDGVHPNEEGYRILGEHVAAELIRLLDERKEQLPEMSLPSEKQSRKEAGVNRSGSRQRMADAILLE